MPTLATTLSRLLAIIGLGFLLGTGHMFVRTAWLGQPSVAVTRMAPAVVSENASPIDEPHVGTRSTEDDNTEPANSEPASDVSGANEPVSLLDAPVKSGSITLREAHELFEQGVFFLDARHEEDFNAGHIEGAFWMPATRVTTEEGRNDLAIIEPGGTVVIYCTGGDCDASENTANRIERMGFQFDIRILGKGYVDWVEAGLPTGVMP